MAGYWPHSFCAFIYYDFVRVNKSANIFIMICLKFITSLSDVNVIDYSYLSVIIVFKKKNEVGLLTPVQVLNKFVALFISSG